MRLFAGITFLVALLLVSATHAADAIRVEIIAVEEQPGQVVATIGAYGPDGKPLKGLTAANFRALLEETPLGIGDVQDATLGRTPVSVVLLVDVSGSMAGERMNQTKRALQDFLSALDPADQVAIITFENQVSYLQDFTTDRRRLEQAVTGLTPRGNTALYDGVIAASGKASEAGGRRLIIMLSDGEATVGLDKRDASIEAARSNGVGIVAVALGNELDRQYLEEIAQVSGGRLVDAATPAALRQAYADLADFIRSQYTLTLQVPQSVDRTVPSKLTIHVSLRSDSGQAERILAPLAGALAPKFEVTVQGFVPGAKIKEPVGVSAVVTEGVVVAKIEYVVDGNRVATATQPPFGLELDPATFATGAHTLKLVVTDESGRQTVKQLPFLIAAPPGTSIFDILLFLVAGLTVLAVIGGGVYIVFFYRQGDRITTVDGRIRPWASRLHEPSGPVEGWQVPAPPPPPTPYEGPLGRVVVMNEAAVRTGNLDAIREFPIGTAPLTLGSGASCDIRLQDAEGRIAPEEARLWVQKEKLFYHKLTTLSAMATEGVTEGWQILENEEEITVGPYRVLFQALEPEEDLLEGAPPPDGSGRASDETSAFRGLMGAGS